MKRTWKQIGSLLLAFCMLSTLLPTVAFAETVHVDSGTPLGMSGTITAFAPLEEDVAEQTEKIGTTKEELKLPDTLVVTVTTGAAITADISGYDIATDSDAQKKETLKETNATVAVSGWTADPAYDGNIEGVYTFTPALELPDGVTVADGVSVPTITVTVGKAAARGAVSPLSTTGWITVGTQSNLPLNSDQSGTGWAWTTADNTFTITGDLTGPIYIYGADSPITIRTSGSYAVTGNIATDRATTITGGGTLSVTSSISTAIQAQSGGLTIDNVTVNATSTYALGRGILVNQDDLKISGGSLTAQGPFGGITCADGDLHVSGDAKVTANTVPANSGNGSGIYLPTGNMTISDTADVKVSGGTGSSPNYGLELGAVGADGTVTITGGKLTVGEAGSGNIKGNLTVSGETTQIQVKGNVTGYLTVSDGAVTVTGTVDGAITVVAGTVTVNGATIPPAGTRAITWSDLTASGEANTVGTGALTLTFSEDPTSLTLDDITVTGAYKGFMGGTGTIRELGISGIEEEGQVVTVSIRNPSGFTIMPSSKTVAAHKSMPRYSISGTIKGSDTGSGIVGATVLLVSGTSGPAIATTTTDASGAYTFSNILPDTYSIEARCVGYQNGTISGVTVSNANVSGKDLTLTKSTGGTVTTATQLKAELEKTEAQTIEITNSFTVTEPIFMAANHELRIPSGKTLTFSGEGRIRFGALGTFPIHTLTINGGGSLVLACTGSYIGISGSSGTLNLSNINVTVNSSNGINMKYLNVGDGATITSEGENANDIIHIPEYGICTVNTGGSINIKDYDAYGIHLNGGALHINGGTVTIEMNDRGNSCIDVRSYGGTYGELKYSSGTLSGSEGAAIYFESGTTAEGLNGKFSDQNNILTASGAVTVGDYAAAPSAGGLTAGTYYLNDTIFAKHMITIYTQPQDVSATEGAISGSLSVSGKVSNGKTITYQWRKADQQNKQGPTYLIEGATSDTFTIPTDLTEGSYYYYCVLSVEGCLYKESDTATVTVNAPGGTAPTITGVTSPMAMTYPANSWLNFTITFSEPVSVVGTPRIALTVGTTTKYADYTGTLGGNRLTFRYVVQETDVDSDGIVLSSPLDSNGGTIKNAGGTDAVLAFTPPNTSGILVDGVSPVIYTIHGTIKGNDTNTGIEGANVDIKIGGIVYKQTVTNSAGEYSTVPLTAGTYSIEVSAPGYDTATISNIVISDADAIRNLTLTKTDGTTTYAVTVNGSYAGTTGAGSYAKDTTVNIYAGNRSNYTFTGWTSSDVTITGASSKNASFVMPGMAVTVTAGWSYNGGGSSSGGGGGGSYIPPISAPPTAPPNQPVTATTPVTATGGTNGTANANIPASTISDAITRAQAAARVQGSSANGVSVEMNVTMPQGATSLTTAIPQSALQSLVTAGVNQFAVNGAPVSLGLNQSALQSIQSQTSSGITIGMTPATGLTAPAQSMIGSRPVYNITISYTDKDGKTQNITSFGSGMATLAIPYTPGRNEAVGYLFGVYVDGNGNASRIPGSAYDANSRSILIPTNHLSVYGVGYIAPSAKFTDVANHWSKESVDYVVGRGLLSGTSETTFAPNAAMTRGMLVTALGRLAGVDAKAYTKNSFTDVKADSSFRPYIEWAYSKGIVQGIGNNQFAPDRAITREEIAVIFANYAKATAYKLPVTRTAATFADVSSIGSAYKDAVAAMQQAGIMMGEQNNKFNPKSNATRAEVSSMLHRYIKLTIVPATAQDWAKNDDGQYMYYKAGKPLTGTQTIDGVKYFFNTDGTLKNGWVKDGGNWRYYTGNKAAVGWLDISDKRYYFTKDGLMVSGKWLELDGKWYYFNTDGSLAKNTKIDGYEVDGNGVRKSK